MLKVYPPAWSRGTSCMPQSESSFRIQVGIATDSKWESRLEKPFGLLASSSTFSSRWWKYLESSSVSFSPCVEWPSEPSVTTVNPQMVRLLTIMSLYRMFLYLAGQTWSSLHAEYRVPVLRGVRLRTIPKAARTSCRGIRIGSRSKNNFAKSVNDWSWIRNESERERAYGKQKKLQLAKMHWIPTTSKR